MTPNEEPLEMETCTVAQLEELQRTGRTGKIISSTTVMLITWCGSEWHVRFDGFLPPIESHELIDVIAVRAHKRFWLEEAYFSSITGVLSCLRMLDDLGAITRTE